MVFTPVCEPPGETTLIAINTRRLFQPQTLGQLVQVAGIDFQHAVTNRRWAYGAAGTLNLYNPVYGNFTPPAASAFVDDPENTIRQTGFYVQDQLTWDDRWIVVLGLRHDRAENTTEGNPTQKDDAVTKRLALMYKADNGLSPYLSYAESFEPTIGLNGDGRAFKPLRGEQYELGLKYEPAGGFGLVNAAIYDLREENRKAPDPDNPLNQLQTGEARTRGLELEAVLHVARNWDLIATYSYTDSEVLEGTNAGKNLPSVPEHMASLWSQHRFSIGDLTGFRGGFGVRYIGTSWDGTDTLATPSQTLVDAMDLKLGDPATLIQAHIARAAVMIITEPDSFRIHQLVDIARQPVMLQAVIRNNDIAARTGIQQFCCGHPIRAHHHWTSTATGQ